MSSEERCPTCGSDDKGKMLDPFNDELIPLGGPYMNCTNPWHSPAPVDAKPAPLTPYGKALLQRISDYRSGYSCGYSDAKKGTRMRDKDAASLFFGPEASGIPDVSEHQLDQRAAPAEGAEQFREIRPIGNLLLDHPQLEEWTKQGYASQESDGLWLHYTAICSLLHSVDAASLREQLADHEASFDLRWKADMRAIKRWQEAHPGNDNVWPDHADLCVWLMEQLAQAQRHQYDAMRDNWKNVCASDVFQTLKHGELREIMYLLSDGQISVGKAAEAIAEYAHSGIVGSLPPHETADNRDDSVSWKDLAMKVQRELEEALSLLETALQGLYNGFEPDNQSALYKAIKIRRDEMLARSTGTKEGQ